MNKKLVASLISIVLLMQTTVYAADNKVADTKAENAVSTTVEKQENENQKQAEQTLTTVSKEDTRPVLTLDQAITDGLKNSYLFEQVKNQASIATIVKDNSSIVRDDLNKATYELWDAEYLINDGRNQIYEGQNQLDSANAAVGADTLPQALTIKDALGTIPDEALRKQYAQVILSKPGMSLDKVLAEKDDSFETAANNIKKLGLPIDADTIREAVKGVVQQSADKLYSSQSTLGSSTQTYLKSEAEYQAALKYALTSVTSKLSTSTISSLKASSLGDLIVNMTLKQDEVTSYSVDIYRNQIALLVEKTYFDALKNQELLEVKQKAEERGKTQYELAKAAYEVGAKSKDDMIIAKTYYDSTVMNTELQRKDYNTSMIALKKALNMDYSKDVRLEAVEPNITDTYDEKAGIDSALTRRLEVKMAKAQKDVLGYLMTAVDESNYESDSNQKKEVRLLQAQADLQLKSKQADVEADVRTSYTTLESMRKVVERANDLEAGAKETLEIANVKYEVGYGYPNSLLESMNLEGMSGTIVEVIAAEENLINIQEKKIEAMNGFNLARLKYLNDVGILPYK